MHEHVSPESSDYDVAVIGGGLAGLALAIQMAKKQYSVILFEKETYPFHRVCGEYISRESWDFLVSLGLDLPSMQVALIDHLELSSAEGKIVSRKLPLGGFGISRYVIDAALAGIAKEAGVTVMENCKVMDIELNDGLFEVSSIRNTYYAKIACGSFGKRSNMDINWERPFVSNLKNSLNNYIGVKYHVRGDFRDDTVFLHLFENGYAGLVKVDGDLYNFCYLSSADNLKRSGNSISRLESELMARNPEIRKILDTAVKVDEKPVTISQISFESKSRVENHVLMLGDAAGMITPLCGNGMSMALHGSQIAASAITRFLEGSISQSQLEQLYASGWDKEFRRRMNAGRLIQRCFASRVMASILIWAGRLFPPLLDIMISKTHGRPF